MTRSLLGKFVMPFCQKVLPEKFNKRFELAYSLPYVFHNYSCGMVQYNLSDAFFITLKQGEVVL